MSTDSLDGGESATRPEIEVTEEAAEQALSLLEGEGLDCGEAGLRLFVQQGGCAGLSYGMRFDDMPGEDDTIYEHHDLRVFVDPASLKYIEEASSTTRAGCKRKGSTSRTRTSSASVAVANHSGPDLRRCPWRRSGWVTVVRDIGVATDELRGGRNELRDAVLLFEFERDGDLGLVLTIVGGCDLDSEFVDFDPLDVLQCLFGPIDRVVRGVVETLCARADEGDLLENHRLGNYVSSELKYRRWSTRWKAVHVSGVL